MAPQWLEIGQKDSALFFYLKKGGRGSVVAKQYTEKHKNF